MKLSALRRRPALGILLPLAAAAAFGSVADPQRVAASARVDALLAPWDSTHSPGCATLVIHDDEIVHHKAYGMSNLEHDVPIENESIFHVASISKQFTAMAIVLLVERGELTLDDDVRRYLPEVPDFGTPITVRHLLHHTSGLRDQWDLLWLAGWRDDDVKSQSDILDLVSRQRTLNFEPGTEYLYCNTGYTLLAAIVERVTGQSLRRFAEANIFAPLGMKSTHFQDDHTMIVKDRTSAYEPGPDGSLHVSIPVFDNAGATSLFTTTGDLARWDRNFDEPRVGGAAAIATLLEPGGLDDGEPLDYGVGLALGRYRGLATVGHSGADAGYRADYVRFPDQRLAVVVLCNLGTINPARLSRAIAEVYLEGRFVDPQRRSSGATGADASDPEVEVSAADLARVAGLYFNPRTGNVRQIRLDDGRLFYRRGLQSESELAPLDGESFVMLDVPARVVVRFEASDVGTAPEMHVTVGDQPPLVHQPVAPVSYTAADLFGFAGDYHSAELASTYTVSVNGDRLELAIPRQPSAALRSLFADAFAGDGNRGLIRFTRDEWGAVSGFELSTGRVRNLRFDRRPR